MAMTTRCLCSLLLLAVIQAQPASELAPLQGDVVLKNFGFMSGETLPELRIHYRTYGRPETDAQGIVRNAVLVMHGTGGTGAQFVGRNFSGELFGPGQPLDPSRYYIVLPDGIGHGQSSKPSDGLRARFPRYGYVDMVEAQHRLLTEGLGVNHLRLVMGTSMGGMHTWLYTAQPQSLRTAAQMLWVMSSNPILRQRQAPSPADADRTIEEYVANYVRTADANDVLYAFEASRDYDPGPALDKIRAPLLAVNSADDLINPPELDILEREIKRVPRGRAVVVPLSERTAGHGTHTLAAVWKSYLEELLRESAR